MVADLLHTASMPKHVNRDASPSLRLTRRKPFIIRQDGALAAPFAMGRAGIEPATLGLRVEAAGLSTACDSSRELFVEPIGSGRMVWSRIALLTFR